MDENKILPKAYEPHLYEDDIYKKWEESGCFNPDNLKLPKNALNYSIVMPPPNVTGTLHMGHAAMLALEDILIRYHRMKGERTLWVPGTDHAAIATQTKVEKIIKEEGLDRQQLGRVKFLERVRQFAHESHDTIVNQVKKMGSSCDWSREAYTLDETRTKAVRYVFKMMYDDGLIYRGKRIVNWCPRCASTLADDEVEYKEVKGKLYWLKYGPFVLATTRPETKLGDTAVAVYPGDKRYEKMVGKKFMIPGVLGEFEIVVVADKAVDPEFGSGAIKVTPAHDFADYEIAQRHNVPMKQIINEKGRMMDNCGKYAGLTTKEARAAIVADMEKMELIDHIDDNYAHNIAVCYRCETQIEPIPSLQWFINVNKKISRHGMTIKELSIEAVKTGVFGREKIKIVPERFEKNYYNWMENLRDWCISRQIWFGHRIPVWYKNRQQTADSRQEDNKENIYIGLEPPGDDGWTQDEDTLDTWFSSGLWTFSTMAKNPDEINIEDGKLVIDSEEFRRFHPTAVLETGYDILFFWVARMIIMTTYALGDIPFKDVYLHGLILDEKGKKMSKSKGNVIDPLDMIKIYGTDATRLSLVMGTSPGADMKLWEEKVAGFRNFVNKLWNVARYIITSYELKITNYEFNTNKFTIADNWILGKMEDLINHVTQDLDNYCFAQAGERLRAFTWDDLADWYLEVSKFEKGGEKEKILFYVLTNLLKLWHPLTPFVTEKIWQELFSKKQLIVESWPRAERGLASLKEAKLLGGFDLVKNIIIAIRNARSEHKIEPARKIKAVIYAGDKLTLIKSQETLIKSLRTGIDELDIRDKGEKIKGAIYVTIDGVEIYLLGAVDSEKEKARLEKEIANLEKLIKALDAKLSNSEFTAKAPEQVVSQEKGKLEKYRGDLVRLNEQMDKL